MSWARVDPGTYTQAFTGQLVVKDNWCVQCHSLHHSSTQCPLSVQGSLEQPVSRGPTRMLQTPVSSMAFSDRSVRTGTRYLKRSHNSSEDSPGKFPKICHQYNDNKGNCRFGRTCRYRHVCRACYGNHPVSRCKLPAGHNSDTN